MALLLLLILLQLFCCLKDEHLKGYRRQRCSLLLIQCFLLPDAFSKVPQRSIAPKNFKVWNIHFILMEIPEHSDVQIFFAFVDSPPSEPS